MLLLNVSLWQNELEWCMCMYMYMYIDLASA